VRWFASLERASREEDGLANGPTGSAAEREPDTGYEPPRVERVLTPAEVEREILYAGGPITDA
jgi:hypothetical protein